jgi:serine/threonine protein kinase
MHTTPTHFGKYELLERLGHGGAAEVWKALDTQLQRFVAIKLLRPNLREDPDFLLRFQREAQFIAQLHHPNIVQIHDFEIYQASDAGNEDTIPIACMVMDYVEGQTLAAYIHATSNQGQIPAPIELVNLFASIGQAVDYAHQKGVIHRDIKPANILLDSRNTITNPMGEPILTDFGVARMLSAASNTLTGTQLSTPLYISPEQASGYPGNERSDLYALGVILYEMTTGQVPFHGHTAQELLQQHITMSPPAPEQVNTHIPPALSHVITRSLAKDPAARFSSASELTRALAEALQLPLPKNQSHLIPTVDPSSRSRLADAIPAHPAPSTPSIPPTPPDGNTPFPMMPAQGSSSGEGAWTPFLGINEANAQASTPGPFRGSGSITPLQGPVSGPGMLTPATRYASPLPTVPAAAPMPPNAPPVAPSGGTRARRPGWWPVAIICLVLVLIGSALGSFFLLFKPTPVQTPPGPIAGQAHYLSSGQLNAPTAQGIADEMQIDLKNVAPPKSGNSYYVWLLGDKHPDTHPDLIGPRPLTPPILLTSNLPVNNGTVHYIYDGSKTQHNNLIATTSRLLITEQPSGQNIQAPSTNRTDWRYYAEIPQEQIPNDSPGFSALTHIRHLFYNETNISVLGLNGGLDFWMSRNVEKIVEWSVSARDNWDGDQTTPAQASLMANLLISMLDYLDGSINVHIDVPAGTPLVVDPLSSRVSLLTVVPDQQVAANFDHNPPGYLDHAMLHVGQVGKAIDISPQTRQLTIYILNALTRAEALLQQVRQDAIKLFQNRNNLAQIRQASTQAMLDDMTTRALYAYLGQVDPTTNQVLPAILQAHYAIQQLATLTVTSQLPQSI